MKLLLVAATELEIKTALNWLDEEKYPDVDVLITGVGMMAAAWQLGRYFARNRPDLAIQAGIAGSFRRGWPLGETVLVARETLGDLGADDNGRFLDLFDMGLWEAGMPPFTEKELVNTLRLFPESLQGLPQATGVTVNTVSGSETAVARLQAQYRPDVETMEGAPFHYSCLLEQVPFVQLRSISNYVEPRDKSKWNISLALQNLNNTLRSLLEELRQKE
ncbi:futalosine hydrolase [Chitinophaga alhagiae]|uniref:futalosine hydrolase n=1 Tax=Chitinophaga alhagiae TaxID=2203219 RepID=UPI0013005879|nr:futalosine hydrolase [Chitinophaga alhagiae]